MPSLWKNHILSLNRCKGSVVPVVNIYIIVYIIEYYYLFHLFILYILYFLSVGFNIFSIWRRVIG
jgi:hypothetical protein